MPTLSIKTRKSPHLITSSPHPLIRSTSGGSESMYRANDQIGPYTLVRRLGQGSSGIVWLAERRGKLMTTQVAIKLPLEEDASLESISKEAQLWLAASGHPNVLP